MSDFFKNLKKNIIPFQKLIEDNIQHFIETMFDTADYDDYYSYDYEYEYNNDDNNENEYNTDIECDTDNKINDTVDEPPVSETPTQQIFKDMQIQTNESLTQNKSIIDEENKDDTENINSFAINDEETIINTILDSVILINNLLVLSNLGANQKLYVNYIMTSSKLNYEILIDNSYLPQFSRWYYNQSRVNTINTIDNLVDLTIEQIDYYKHSKNEEQLKKITDLLQKSLIGLINLKTTYISDNENSYKITKIINKINEHFNQ